MGLRERNRRAAMRETQAEALRLFHERGFSEVTIADVAESAGMSASTIYRHFGTKEAIVLWDEHEAELDAELVRRLKKQAPMQALRDVFVEHIGERYDQDDGYQLRRIRFIFQTEAVHAAAVEEDFKNRADLGSALAATMGRRLKHKAPLLAAVALVSLDVAIEQWQGSGSSKSKRTVQPSLAQTISDVFEDLTTIGDLAS